jgi:hypothetical protein
VRKTSIKLILASLVILLATGCANKAKLVQLGAEQFSEKSGTAIEKIDALRRAETAVTPIPPAKAEAKFVALVLKSNSPIDRKKLRLLTDPVRTKRVPNDAAWQTFIGTLRHHHDEFNRTFARLDQGSLLAAPKVKKAIPVLDRLMAQIVAFAGSIRKKPAEMTRERAGIAAEMEIIRDDQNRDTEAKKLLLAESYRRLRAVEAREQQMTRDVLEQSMQAVLIGRELRKLLQKYDQLSIDDIAESMSTALSIAGQVLGKDLSTLDQRTKNAIDTIKSDPDLSGFMNTALSEINNARANP